MANNKFPQCLSKQKIPALISLEGLTFIIRNHFLRYLSKMKSKLFADFGISRHIDVKHKMKIFFKSSFLIFILAVKQYTRAIIRGKIPWLWIMRAKTNPTIIIIRGLSPSDNELHSCCKKGGCARPLCLSEMCNRDKCSLEKSGGVFYVLYSESAQ